MMISSFKRDYLFRAAPPVGREIAGSSDAYDFGLAGYKAKIIEIPYDQSRCARANAVKTVCPQPDGSTIVVFGDRSSFQIVFTDAGVGAARLEQISAEIVATFSQGISKQKSSSK